MFSNFIKKTIGGINESKKKKKPIKVQASSICVNHKRSNTYKQSIEKKMVAQDILVKSKMRFLVWLRIRLLIIIRIATERDNLMRFYGWSIPYT